MQYLKFIITLTLIRFYGGFTQSHANKMLQYYYEKSQLFHSDITKFTVHNDLNTPCHLQKCTLSVRLLHLQSYKSILPTGEPFLCFGDYYDSLHSESYSVIKELYFDISVSESATKVKNGGYFANSLE